MSIGDELVRAIVCEKPLAITLSSREHPARREGEVLVRVRRVGLCGTDYNIYSGKHPYLSYPRIMGHELAAEVLEAAPDSRFRPRQLITLNPYLPCHRCVACRKGKPNCCISLEVLGVHVDGGMREVMAVPESAVIVAEGLSLEQAAMVEFLAIGAHAVRRAAPTHDERALIVGAGPIGIAVALFARLVGVRVTLIDKLAARLEYARERLAMESTVPVGSDTNERLCEITSGEMFDLVFDATGDRTAMCSGLRYVAHGGKYVLLSVIKEDISFPDPEFHKRETTLLASRNALKEDFDEVIRRISDGSIPTRALHTHSVAAADVPQRLPELIANMDSVLKAIVTF